MRYNFKATVNYSDATDVETPDFYSLTAASVTEMVAALLEAEPSATSYLITVVPVREK